MNRLQLYLPLILCSFVVCCSDDDEAPPLTVSPLTISATEERFNAAGDMHVVAGFTSLQPDTISTVGFIYTDAQADTVMSLKPGDAHTIAVSLVQPDEKAGRGQYFFEAVINPERSTPRFGFTRVVSIFAYAITTSGRTIVSRHAFFYQDKPLIYDIFPARAPAGAPVRCVLNRAFYQDSIYNHGGIRSKGYMPSLLIGTQIVTPDSIPENGGDFYFNMPAGISDDQPVKLRIGEYESTWSGTMRNTSVGFQKVAVLKREDRGEQFVFATQTGIYLGGGIAPGNNSNLTDFWKYTHTTKSWARVADYPAPTSQGMAFTVGSSTYCGSPHMMSRYDETTNTWHSVAQPTGSLSYDHTLGLANSAVYQGKAYIMDFTVPVNLGGVYLDNFYRFDPTTEIYTQLPAYPGESVRPNNYAYLNKGVVFRNQLHFFRNNKHWKYDIASQTWTQLNDVFDADQTKAFSYKNQLYVIIARNIPGGFLGGYGREHKLYRYNDARDSWELDGEVPRIVADYPIGPTNTTFMILQAGEEDVYLCQADYPDYIFYRIR